MIGPKGRKVKHLPVLSLSKGLGGTPSHHFTGLCITVNIAGLYETKILFGEDYERTINRGIRSNPVVERAG